jgi:hypothetical protein
VSKVLPAIQNWASDSFQLSKPFSPYIDCSIQLLIITVRNNVHENQCAEIFLSTKVIQDKIGKDANKSAVKSAVNIFENHGHHFLYYER